jgi:hypothetical protein
MNVNKTQKQMAKIIKGTQYPVYYFDARHAGRSIVDEIKFLVYGCGRGECSLFSRNLVIPSGMEVLHSLSPSTRCLPGVVPAPISDLVLVSEVFSSLPVPVLISLSSVDIVHSSSGVIS